MNEPFMAVGNDELGEAVGETYSCQCGQVHTVEYGHTVHPDGTKTASNALAFVRCGEKTYLIGIHGRLIGGEAATPKPAAFRGQCQHGRPFGQECVACGRKH